MRGLGLIVTLILAAAAGAAAMYFLKPAPPAVHELLGGPGNGVVTCPGNASCPNENKALDDRSFYGIGAPADTVGPNKIELCDGTAAGHCPAGFVGYLVPHIQPPRPQDDGYILTCNPGNSAFCKDHNIAAVFCMNRQTPKAPKTKCDVLLGFKDPNYQP